MTANDNAVVPVTSIADAIQLGELFERSGMFGCTQPGQGVVLVLSCLSERMSPMQFKRTYHLIDGNPSMRSDAMLAKFVERGGRYTVREYSPKRAAALFETGDNSMEMEITIEQALEAGWPISHNKDRGIQKDGKLWKSNWYRTPAAMLWARLVSMSVRLLDPGVNAGCYAPEELADLDDRSRPAARDAAMTTRPAPSAAPEPANAKPAAAVEDDPAPAAQAPAAETPATETSPASPAPAPASEAVDFTVCPIGRIAGKKWADLNSETLATVLGAARPEITAAHRAEIEKVLNAEGGK